MNALIGSAIISFILPLNLMSQERGLQFVQAMSWDQVRNKARAEKKYIFVDVFATWCAPCKQMDKLVYTDSSMGIFFEKHFVSVKLQMDETKDDNARVISWRPVAKDIERKFKIIAYPSYLFFSPNGELVALNAGFKRVDEFLLLAEEALLPGMKYKSPYLEYDFLVSEFNRGVTHFDKIPYMVRVSREINRMGLADSLCSAYFNYLEGLPLKRLLTKNRISFISENIKTSNSGLFSLFYPNGRQIDSVMNRSRYSRSVVDRVIKTEITFPLIEKFIDENSMKTVKNGAEPNWNSMFNAVATNFNADYAERIIRSEKVDFYWLTKEVHKDDFVSNFLILYARKEADTTKAEVDASLNNLAWYIFLYSADRRRIDTAMDIIRGVLRRKNAFANYQSLPLDTYANLLYKANQLFGSGKIEDAIACEQRAVENARLEKNDDEFEYLKTIIKMKNRERTWEE